MKTKKIILALIFVLIHCRSKINEKPNNDAILDSIVVLECFTKYGVMNPLYNRNSIPPYKGEKVLWIADSTIFFSKLDKNFTTKISDTSRVFYGNTACDFLNQIRSAKPGVYDTLIVSSADGNGVLRNVSTQTSIDTLNKVYDYATYVLKVKKIIVVGIHPIKDETLNARKNEVNRMTKAIANERGYCFVDMVSLFGKGENDFPDDDQLATGPDGLPDKTHHYAFKFYPLLKNEIKYKCGTDI